MNQAGDSHSTIKGAIILAGGDSKRLGRPKALLDFQGQTLIELMVEHLGLYFKQVTVVTDRPGLYTNLPVLLTADLLADQQKSPLRGIHAGLSASDFPCQFVVACDMPFLNLNLIAYMSRFSSDYDAVVPRINSYFQPLHAFYSRSCIAVIENQLKQECYKVTDFYASLKIRYIGEDEIMRFDPDQQSFININTGADYEEALKILAKSLKTD
ncbi:MAG: molybdenum cofactor guanylyltransferase [Clostridia bacterium]|nr:molybdenum cofactor guanylyltransferase [Clostridia bacterium]